MRNDNRYIIQDHAVVVTPSTSAYLRASHTSTTTPRALLSVGNSLGSEPSPLPAAESEAEEIAAMYPSHALLVEGDATKDRVVGALPLCDAAHFAVHANAGLGAVVPPHLILTKTADDEGILTAPEIAALHLNHLRTVMLAGCRTALSSQPGDDSLVNAFLVAGAGSVVWTLWEVEDASTRTMSTMFHRELRTGSTPAEALRITQREMIRRGAPSSVTNAWMSGEEGIDLIAVNAAPCGYCRQFLNELTTADRLIVAMPKETRPLSELLPSAFGPRDLGIAGGLMQRSEHGLTIEEDDDVARAALQAANMSYAPYSKSFAGVAVRTASGHIASGAYAENAAFNPSMSPLEVALSRLNLAGESFDAIEDAVLVHTDSLHFNATRVVLNAVTKASLRLVEARNSR